MTFAPVLPAAMLIAIAAVVVVLRLITMRQLATARGQRWSTVWRWAALTLAVVLMLIAAARPALGSDERHADAAPEGDANANVFLLVDRSVGPRMADIGDDLAALIDRYPGARFALITFAARPSLEWPLSEDAWSLKPVAANLPPYQEDSAGVNAAAAANILRYQLIAAAQRHPGSRNFVFYFGSGAPSSQAPQGAFDPVPGTVDGGAVFGYGEPRDEANLRRIAEQLGVRYTARDSMRSVTEATPDAAGAVAPRSAAAMADHTELYWVFTVAAAVLLLFEIYLNLREFRASRTARRDVVL